MVLMKISMQEIQGTIFLCSKSSVFLYSSAMWVQSTVVTIDYFSLLLLLPSVIIYVIVKVAGSAIHYFF